MIKVTNRIKVDMKKRQYKLLKEYFEKYGRRGNPRNDNDREIIERLYYMYSKLPADIERFEMLALMDEKQEELKSLGYPVATMVKIGAETRSLEEIAAGYKRNAKARPKMPMAKEFATMYSDMVKEYSIGGKYNGAK